MPFVGLAIVPEFASSVLLPRLVGHAKAAQMLMLNEAFSAREAVSMGLANAVLDPDAVLDHARAAAKQLSALPQAAVRETKRLMRSPFREEVSTAIVKEALTLAERLDSAEAKEAFRAFLNKRHPTTGGTA